MRIELSQYQIEELFRFVRSKYVKYIDVQHELVDHLASAIEDEMEKDSQLSFDEALKLVYGRFPVTGFNNFIKAKEKEIARYWRIRAYSYFKQFFTLPLCLVALGIFSINTVVYSLFGPVPFMITFFSIWMYIMYTIWRDEDKYRYIDPQKVLFYKSFRYSIMSPGFVLLPMYLWNYIEPALDFSSQITLVLLNAFLTFFLIWCYATIAVFPKMLDDEIKIKYRHIVF